MGQMELRSVIPLVELHDDGPPDAGPSPIHRTYEVFTTLESQYFSYLIEEAVKCPVMDSVTLLLFSTVQVQVTPRSRLILGISLHRMELPGKDERHTGRCIRDAVRYYRIK